MDLSTDVSSDEDSMNEDSSSSSSAESEADSALSLETEDHDIGNITSLPMTTEKSPPPSTLLLTSSQLVSTSSSSPSLSKNNIKLKTKETSVSVTESSPPPQPPPTQPPLPPPTLEQHLSTVSEGGEESLQSSVSFGSTQRRSPSSHRSFPRSPSFETVKDVDSGHHSRESESRSSDNANTKFYRENRHPSSRYSWNNKFRRGPTATTTRRTRSPLPLQQQQHHYNLYRKNDFDKRSSLLPTPFTNDPHRSSYFYNHSKNESSFIDQRRKRDYSPDRVDKTRKNEVEKRRYVSTVKMDRNGSENLKRKPELDFKHDSPDFHHYHHHHGNFIENVAKQPKSYSSSTISSSEANTLLSISKHQRPILRSLTILPGSAFVLCIHNDGFTLTNGFACYCKDYCQNRDENVKNILILLDVGLIICTDHSTYNALMIILNKSFEQNLMLNVQFQIWSEYAVNIGKCPECKLQCHRYRSSVAASKLFNYNGKVILHGTVATD